MMTTATAVHSPSRSTPSGRETAASPARRTGWPAARPARHHQHRPDEHAHVAHGRNEQDHAAHGGQVDERHPGLRGFDALELAGVHAPRHAHQSGDVAGDAEQLHAHEPEVRLQRGYPGPDERPAGNARQHPVAEAHEAEGDGVPTVRWKCPWIQAVLRNIAFIAYAALMAPPKPPSAEGDHRQRHAGEERIPPGQPSDPPESAIIAARRPASSSDAITVKAVTRLGNMIA